jgi:hypothetical protein
VYFEDAPVGNGLKTSTVTRVAMQATGALCRMPFGSPMSEKEDTNSELDCSRRLAECGNLTAATVSPKASFLEDAAVIFGDRRNVRETTSSASAIMSGTSVLEPVRGSRVKKFQEADKTSRFPTPGTRGSCCTDSTSKSRPEPLRLGSQKPISVCSANNARGIGSC